MMDENTLYPLKFMPLLKYRIWGGNKLNTRLGIDTGPMEKCGEAWVLSAVEESESVVENGFLAESTLQELIEIYMDDLVGEKVYEEFGEEFPLLIKFIDANDKLSIQVHPDDELAQKRNIGKGKTEMWYIIDAEPNAELINGFKLPVSKQVYLKHLRDKTLPEILNIEKVKADDVFFIPAGRVHALGEGLLLAEIQQTSDTTYRLYDWDRTEADGKPRQLHIEEALDAIDFSESTHTKVHYHPQVNKTVPLVECPYFTTNVIEINQQQVQKDYTNLDSFVVYICLAGNCVLKALNTEVTLQQGETVLLPAITQNAEIVSDSSTKLLEVYIC